MQKIKKWLLEPDFRVLVLYRMSEKFKKKNSSFFSVCSLLIRNHLKVKYSVEFNNIYPIGSGMKLFHFHGIVIGYGVRIGENVNIYNNVTIGGKRTATGTQYPQIGNNVTIYPGVRIIGGIKIGDNVIIGPNAVVYKDLEESQIVVCSNYKVLK